MGINNIIQLWIIIGIRILLCFYFISIEYGMILLYDYIIDRREGRHDSLYMVESIDNKLFRVYLFRSTIYFKQSGTSIVYFFR